MGFLEPVKTEGLISSPLLNAGLCLHIKGFFYYFLLSRLFTWVTSFFR